MLDLETMGNGPNAAIVAIGAVRFKQDIQDDFYTVIDLQSSIDAGLTMDASTVLWWMKQNDEARQQFNRQGASLKQALEWFSSWIGQNAQIWGNGAAFDNAILSNAYKKCNIKQPWHYGNDRCYRTLKALYPQIKMQRTGVHHIAVEDARNQAEHLIQIFTQLNLSHL